MIGRRAGHFEILEKIGEGGMGIVYKARDLDLGRLVALKVLPASADSDRRQRFVREAQSASALNHPNIVTVHEIFREDGSEFIAMELVQGKTLDQAMEGKAMRLQGALKIGAQVAAALADAHAAGIVHRDLKPSNVMVTGDGHVKVVDFGLAKLTEQAVMATDNALTATVPVTGKGTVLGTVAYMSPEQAEGKAVDWRSDIFSFGALLYEMVTGRRAFQAESRLITLAAVMESEPEPISEFAPAVPRELQRLIARCLRKKANERAQSMLDIMHALEELRAELDSGQLSGAVPAALPHKPAWWPAALAATLLIATAVLFVSSRWNRSSTAAVYKPIPLTSYPGRERGPALSPDGRQVAFEWDGPEQNNFDIYVRLVGAGEPLRLTSDPATDTHPNWSPDGQFIAFYRLNQNATVNSIYVVPALGGSARKLCEVPAARGAILRAVWSADGKVLVVTEAHALSVVNVETGEKTPLQLPSPYHEGHFHPLSPALSPDGKRLAFGISSPVAGDTLNVADFAPSYRIEGFIRQIFKTGTSYLDSIAWSPDGKSLLFTDARGDSKPYRISADGGSNPELLAGLGDHVEGLTVAGSRLAYMYSFNDDNLWRIDLNPGIGPSAPKPFLHSTRRERLPQISPDGSKIAFVSNRSGENEIWVSALDGVNPRQLTRQAWPLAPVWSPDSRSIVYQGNSEAGVGLFILPAHGGAPRAAGPAGAGDPHWSHDGKWIYFAHSYAADRVRLYRMPSTGQSETASPMPAGIRVRAFVGDSPDGTTLYGSEYEGKPGLWKVPLEEGKSVLVAAKKGIRAQAAGRDGIYFVERESTTMQLYRFADGKVIDIARFAEPFPLPGSFTISSDRKTILYSKIDQSVRDLMLVENFR